jgi:hypothetical protein
VLCGLSLFHPEWPRWSPGCPGTDSDTMGVLRTLTRRIQEFLRRVKHLASLLITCVDNSLHLSDNSSRVQINHFRGRSRWFVHDAG